MSQSMAAQTHAPAIADKSKKSRSKLPLSPSQLALKRVRDRDAQRASRARTAAYILKLEQEISELNSKQINAYTAQNPLGRKSFSELELINLRKQLHFNEHMRPYQVFFDASIKPDATSDRLAQATDSIVQNLNYHSSMVPRLLSGESRERRHTELQLLHYFIVRVCPTMPGGHLPLVRQIWSVDIPAMAMEYEPLLNAVLSLSILYLSYNDNNSGILQPNQLLSYGAEYLGSTLRGHRIELDSLNKSTADPASFTSIILSFHAFASLRERSFQPYQPPIQWLQLCNGVMSVLSAAMWIVRSDTTAKINLIHQSCSSFVEGFAISSATHLNRLSHLLIPRPGELSTDEDISAYSGTLHSITALVIAQEAGERYDSLCLKLVIYPSLWPKRFLDLLSLRRPRALCILAHFFGVASNCGISWMVDDNPQREVRAITEYLGSDWQHEMAWPLAAIKSTSTPMDSSTTA